MEGTTSETIENSEDSVALRVLKENASPVTTRRPSPMMTSSRRAGRRSIDFTDFYRTHIAEAAATGAVGAFLHTEPARPSV
jgi:hypothetical protein